MCSHLWPLLLWYKLGFQLPLVTENWAKLCKVTVCTICRLCQEQLPALLRFTTAAHITHYEYISPHNWLRNVKTKHSPRLLWKSTFISTHTVNSSLIVLTLTFIVDVAFNIPEIVRIRGFWVTWDLQLLPTPIGTAYIAITNTYKHDFQILSVSQCMCVLHTHNNTWLRGHAYVYNEYSLELGVCDYSTSFTHTT